MNTGSKAADRKGTGKPYSRIGMTERQLEAYLVSRDALRRIQRTSALLSATSLRQVARHFPR